MVFIQKVTFYDRLQLATQRFSHSEDVLLIRQSNLKERMDTHFSLFIKKHEEERIHLFDDELGIIEVSLRLMNDFDIKRELAIPLEVTREMVELTYLLFNHYFHNPFNCSVNQVISRLVMQAFSVNSRTLNGSERFLMIIQFMEDNLAKSLQLTDFCSALHFSEANLNRFCKKQSGMTAMELFRKIKCLEVDRLLTETSLTIKEISGELGFKENSHFTTMYKRVVGVTPLERRRRLTRALYSKEEQGLGYIRTNYNFRCS